MNGYLSTWKKSFTFAGRASRSEYWLFYLFSILLIAAIGILAAIIVPAMTRGSESGASMVGSLAAAGAISLIALLIFFPFLSVLVRRLHDTNRSGWWFWIALIPFIGGIWLFVLTVLDSSPGTNNYGPHPYANDGAAGGIQTV